MVLRADWSPYLTSPPPPSSPAGSAMHARLRELSASHMHVHTAQKRARTCKFPCRWRDTCPTAAVSQRVQVNIAGSQTEFS